MAEPHEKLATQVDPVVLDGIRSLARQEGRQLQALVEEALADFVEQRKSSRSRPNLIAEYYAGRDKYRALSQKLEAIKASPASLRTGAVGTGVDFGMRSQPDAANN